MERNKGDCIRVRHAFTRKINKSIFLCFFLSTLNMYREFFSDSRHRLRQLHHHSDIIR